MTATDESGASRQFRVVARLDGEIDVTYLSRAACCRRCSAAWRATG